MKKPVMVWCGHELGWVEEAKFLHDTGEAIDRYIEDTYFKFKSFWRYRHLGHNRHKFLTTIPKTNEHPVK